MPIVLAPRQPMLLTTEQRIPSAEMEISRSKPKIVIANKSVQFYEVVAIRSTTHFNDMTDEEISSAWYSRKEMIAIKKAMSTEVKFMTLGKLVLMSEDHTARGLEFRTPEGSERRKANKLDSIHAVLDEQDLQHMHGTNDPEGLRRVYMGYSRRCLSESQALGKADEIEVSLIQTADQQPDMHIDENDTKYSQKASPKDNVFLRLFTKKRAVMEEIKQLNIWALPA